MAAPDGLGMHRDRQDAAGLVLPGVAQLARPDLEDLRRRAHRPDAPRARLELGPVVERPADRDLDERSGPAEVGGGPVVALVDRHAVGMDVIGHQRRVVAEAEVGDVLEGPRPERPVRRPEARRGDSGRLANASNERSRIARSSSGCSARSSWAQPWQPSSWPPATIAATLAGNVTIVWPGTNQVALICSRSRRASDPRRRRPVARTHRASGGRGRGPGRPPTRSRRDRRSGQP